MSFPPLPFRSHCMHESMRTGGQRSLPPRSITNHKRSSNSWTVAIVPYRMIWDKEKKIYSPPPFPTRKLSKRTCIGLLSPSLSPRTAAKCFLMILRRELSNATHFATFFGKLTQTDAKTFSSSLSNWSSLLMGVAEHTYHECTVVYNACMHTRTHIFTYPVYCSPIRGIPRLMKME